MPPLGLQGRGPVELGSRVGVGEPGAWVVGAVLGMECACVGRNHGDINKAEVN